MIWFLLGGVFGGLVGFGFALAGMYTKPRELGTALLRLAATEDKARALGGRRNWRGKWVLR